MLGYYGYPCYWGTGGLWGTGSFPSLLLNANQRGPVIPAHREDIERVLETGEAGWDPDADTHLRSCSVVIGYRIEATDGHMGEVKDFLVEESTWAIRYLVVNTSEWWSGHDVLVAVRWIDSVRWMDNAVTVSLTREAVKASPAYDPERTLDCALEAAFFQHHGKPAYWADQRRDCMDRPVSNDVRCPVRPRQTCACKGRSTSASPSLGRVRVIGLGPEPCDVDAAYRCDHSAAGCKPCFPSGLAR